MIKCESVLEHLPYQKCLSYPASSVDSNKFAFFAVVQAIKNILLNISSYYIRHGLIFKLAKSSEKCEFWQEFDV